MTVREILKFFHLLASMMWFGGAVWARILAIRVAASRNEVRALDYARDMLFGTRVFTGSKVGVLVTGVLLVLESKGWRYGHGFVVIGLVVSGLAVLLGFVYFKPQSERVVAEIEAGAFGRPHNIARMRMLGRVSTVEMSFFVIALWAMVARIGL